MNITNSAEEIKELLIKSGNARQCEQVFLLSQEQCKEKSIFMTDVQKLSLLYHLSAMVHRSITGEKLVPIDQSIFSEISKESFSIAKKVKDSIEELEENEIYLLSIHFEAAKQNS
jgi:PRD domain protein (TIGR03582 family)